MKHEGHGDEETTRSGLFMDQVRIVKEMRANDIRNGRTGKFIRPRYMVWENVPGAFSSNRGRDFQAVLEEIIKIADPTAPGVPLPEAGRWSKSGFIYDEMGQWSVAWTVHDAQFHGVPQRRKRVSLLADFAGLSAMWIMFDPQFERETEESSPNEAESNPGAKSRSKVQSVGESVSRNSESSGEAGQAIAGSPGAGAESAGGAGCLTNDTGDNPVGFTNRCYASGDVAETLRAEPHGAFPMVAETICLEGNGSRESHLGSGYSESDVMYTLNTIEQHGVLPLTESEEPIPINTMVGTRTTDEKRTTMGVGQPGEPQFTLSAAHEHAVFYKEPFVLESNQDHATVTDSGISPTLPAAMGMGGGYVPMVSDRWTIDEKIGQTYIHHDQANTLAARDYKQPQAVLPESRAISFQERAGKPGGGKGILIQDERTGALSTLNIQHVLSLETYHCESEEDTAMTLKARDYKDPQSVLCIHGESPHEQ